MLSGLLARVRDLSVGKSEVFSAAATSGNSTDSSLQSLTFKVVNLCNAEEKLRVREIVSVTTCDMGLYSTSLPSYSHSVYVTSCSAGVNRSCTTALVSIVTLYIIDSDIYIWNNAH